MHSWQLNLHRSDAPVNEVEGPVEAGVAALDG